MWAWQVQSTKSYMQPIHYESKKKKKYKHIQKLKTYTVTRARSHLLLNGVISLCLISVCRDLPKRDANVWESTGGQTIKKRTTHDTYANASENMSHKTVVREAINKRKETEMSKCVCVSA